MAPQRPKPSPTPDPARGTGRWPRTAAGLSAIAGAFGRWVLAVAGGEAGRRLARATVTTVALVALVVTLYDRGEVPRAAAQPVVGAAAAPGGSAARGPAAGARRGDPEGRGGLRGRDRPAVGERQARPAEVAAAWYAARHGLPRGRVKPLQQDRRSAREVRVLVLADHGRGRLETALVRLRLGPTGWSVR